MLIIMEGCDGTGKTTAARRIGEALALSGPVDVLHKGPMTDHAIAEYEYPLEDYEPGCGRHIICDRWHVGELVYGPLLRGESRMSEAERRHIDMFLAARGAVICHVTADDDVIRGRIVARGDDLVAHEQVATIVEEYYDAICGHHWHTEIFSAVLVGDDDEDRPALRNLIGVGAYVERAALDLRRFRTYVGPTAPRILLLGERRNATKANVRAAFVPVSGTSGRYLLDALPRDVWATAGIANACEEDLSELWPRLGHPYVVALGRDADRECEVAEIPHGAVPHPQYVRRFHNARASEYGRMIRAAALHGKDLSRAFDHPRA